LIEAEKQSFGDTDNDALRRPLKLPSRRTDKSNTAAIGKDWFDDGVKLPHGTELRMTYNRQLHSGRKMVRGWKKLQ